MVGHNGPYFSNRRLYCNKTACMSSPAISRCMSTHHWNVWSLPIERMGLRRTAPGEFAFNHGVMAVSVLL